MQNNKRKMKLRRINICKCINEEDRAEEDEHLQMHNKRKEHLQMHKRGR
jgi:hypothetical protein